jgi:hypothetical protein
VNALNHLQANLARQQLRGTGPNKHANEGAKGKEKDHPQGKAHTHSHD